MQRIHIMLLTFRQTIVAITYSVGFFVVEDYKT